MHDDYSLSEMLVSAAAREQQDKEMRVRVAQETSGRMENGVNINPRLSAILGSGESMQLQQPKDGLEPLLPFDPSHPLHAPVAHPLYDADEEMHESDGKEQEVVEQEKRGLQDEQEEEEADDGVGAASDDSLSRSRSPACKRS